MRFPVPSLTAINAPHHFREPRAEESTDQQQNVHIAAVPAVPVLPIGQLIYLHATGKNITDDTVYCENTVDLQTGHKILIPSHLSMHCRRQVGSSRDVKLEH